MLGPRDHEEIRAHREGSSLTAAVFRADAGRAEHEGFLWSPLLRAAGFTHAFFTRFGGTRFGGDEAGEVAAQSVGQGEPRTDGAVRDGATRGGAARDGAAGNEGGVQGPARDGEIVSVAELNFSAAHGAEGVARSMAWAAGALGVGADRVYLASQVHGRDVLRVAGDQDVHFILRQRADALVAGDPLVACGVRVADCVPILAGDKTSGAVVAIHSGWQGTELNVVQAAIEALRGEGGRENGRERGRDGALVAAIGPHIGVCCFEVGEDVAARLAACSNAVDVIDRTRGERPHVDLARIVRAQLLAAGVRDGDIDDVPGCTKCDNARFYSFRRDREQSGRHLAAIVPTRT